MRHSIKNKIILTFCLIISVALISSGIIAYYYCFRILEAQTVKSETEKLNLTSRQIEYIAEDVKRFALNTVLDDVIQKFLKTEKYRDNFDETLSIQRAQDDLSKLEVQREYIVNMVLIKGETVVLSKSQLQIHLDSAYYKERLKEQWYQNYLKTSGSKSSFFSSTYDLPTLDANKKVIAYIVAIRDISNPKKVIGQIIVNMDYDYIKNYILVDSSESDDYLWVGGFDYLYHKSGKWDLINQSQLSSYLENIKTGGTYSFNNDKGYAVINVNPNTGWKLVSFITRKTIADKSRFILYFFMIYTILILCVSVIIVMPILYRTVKPILKLTKVMEKVSEGKLDTSITINSGDELEVLARGFNKMVFELKNLISKSIEDEKEKRRIQFSLLLAQINPHFIYNTLHTVIYMATKQNNRDIAAMVESFIAILQDSVRINELGICTTLLQEVEIIRNYISIQSYRYPERFDVIWQIDDKVLDTIMPRSILQPIAENSLLHGILLKKGKGIIKISGFKAEDNLMIIIQDNGVGMDSDKIHQLLNGLENHRKEDKIRSLGVSNVIGRIKYICGDEYGIDIESIKNEFCRFIIRLPLNLKADTDHTGYLK